MASPDAMKTESYSELCRAFLYATEVAGSSPACGPGVGPLITLSRAAGARGTSIAAVLIRKLEADKAIPKSRPWTVFDHNLLEHVIKEHGLPEKTADYFPEDKPEEIRTTIAEMLGLHHGVYNTLVRTTETIRRLARAGNVVIVGRGGNLITGDMSCAVHIRLVGSVEKRALHFARHNGISPAQAKDEVARLDRARKRYIKTHFKKDIDDPLLYDMVFNTDEFSDAQAAEVILATLRAKLA
jgi:cytidylate kinase